MFVAVKSDKVVFNRGYCKQNVIAIFAIYLPDFEWMKNRMQKQDKKWKNSFYELNVCQVQTHSNLYSLIQHF